MKTKLYKQLLVAALSLLIAVPALAEDMTNTVTIHFGRTPAMASATIQLKPMSQDTPMQTDDSTYVFKLIPGNVLDLRLFAYADYSWSFVNWVDGNGNVLTTQQQYDFQISAAGEYYYTANYRYYPMNPGYLPMGSYDLNTATLTIYNPIGGEMMMNFYALADKYNLPAGGKHHQADMPMPSQGDYNPIDKLVIQGYITDYWDIRQMSYFTAASVYDLSQVTFPENAIGEGSMMDNTTLETLIIGSNVEYIRPYAFQGVYALTDVYCYAETVPHIDSTSFIFTGSYWDEQQHEDVEVSEHGPVTLHVPASAYVAYTNDSVWPLLFTIEPMAISTTANLSILPSMILEGMTLRLSQVGTTEEMTLNLNPSQTRYEVMNLEKGASYHVVMLSPLGFQMDEKTFVLNADTAITLTNAAPLGAIPAHATLDGVDITDQVLISWFDNTGELLLGTGDMSPLLPMQYQTQINVLPMGELSAYLEPKDTFTVNQLGHNGLWIAMERKPVGSDEPVVETGTVVVSLSGDATNMVGLLYDSEGNLLGKSSFEQMMFGPIIALPGMPVGCYTVVVMREGQYSTLSRLELYQQMGLTPGTDYVLNDFCILANQITQVAIETVPEEPQIDNFLSSDAHFYASKQEVMVAGQIILTAEVGFLEEYVENISNLFYVIDLPENLQLIEGSVMVGNSSAQYSFQNGQLRVGTGLANLANKNATALRFCVAPTAVGDYYPSASVEFNYNSQAKAQPISNTYFTAQAITIQAPPCVIERGVTVTGFAPAYASVNILTAENETIGTGTANALGKYNIRCAFTASGSRTLTLHAEASTPLISGLMSDTCSTYYDAAAAAPREIQMTHYNKWYKKNMTIVWNLDSCTTNQKYYYYYLNADFTFRAQFVGDLDTVTFVAIGQDGSRTNIPAHYAGNHEWYATEYIQTYKVPVRVDLVFGVGESVVTYEACKSVSAIADPSGYVYEAVSSNRLEGVTATAYMKKDENDLPQVWDAEPYDQKNPLITDEAGGYAWDVPTGWWQVRFTKPGYDPAQTKWLPVPPPQMEVNIPLVRSTEPEVKSVKAYADNVLITFDRYMMVEDLTTAKIQVFDANDNLVPGTIEMLDREERFKGDTIYYASKVKFLPTNEFTTGTVNVHFNQCRSYAGIPMDDVQGAGVSAEVKNFIVPDTVFLTVGEDKQETVYAAPAYAAVGKNMLFDVRQTDLYTVTAPSAVIASNGAATITFHGKMPGTTEMRLAIEGSELETYMLIVVKPAPVPHQPTSVEVVPATDNTQAKPAAVKLFENGTIYLILDDHRYTTTGVMVK